MKIVLKRDWDISISPPLIGKKFHDPLLLGHYVGRNHELSKLVNELLRRPKGSILISGYRGVGKTSLIYKALSELKARDKDHEIIVVMLNAAQLDVMQKNGEVDVKNLAKIDPKKIIENLIRRLYSTTRGENLDKELEKDINLLYRKAVASEVNILETYQNQKNVQHEIRNESKIDFIMNNKQVILIITTIMPLIVLYLDLSIKLIPVLIALLGSFSFYYAFTSTISEEKSITERADETYRSDNCIGNLEFDLEEIHKKLYFNFNKKVIYVIDELDKLEFVKGRVNQVEEILNYFKNFFTLSNAIFVFIGDQDLYDSCLESSKDKHQPQMSIQNRDKNYTYFTSKYFISRPIWFDLKSYLTEIIETTDANDRQLEILNRALCFEAKNDFFDLRKCIDNRITRFDESDRAIIEIVSFDNEDIVKSRMQKAISLVYEEKYMSVNSLSWRDNERLIDSLYNHSASIINGIITDKFEDPKDDSTEFQMIRDFNGLLDDLGALRAESSKSIPIRGISVNIRNYFYTNDFPTEPPLHLNEATEFEKIYIYNFELILKYAKAIVSSFKLLEGYDKDKIKYFLDNPQNLIDGLRKLDYDFNRIYEINYKIYEKITNKKELYSFHREDIEKKTKDLQGATESMLQYNLPNILYQMLKLLNPKEEITKSPIDKNNKIFNIIPDFLRDEFVGNQVIASRDLSKQLLLLNKKGSIYLRQIESELIKNASTHKVVYITRIKGDYQSENILKIKSYSPEELEESISSFLIDTRGFFNISDK
jgi:nucleoside-triphosphatase THEP1